MSLLTSLRVAKENIEKRRDALQEDFDLSAHINPITSSVVSEPFPHIMIDNFFVDTTYRALVNHFTSVLQRGTTLEDDKLRFHPFLNLKGKYAYDGYVYVPPIEETPTLGIFGSVAWNLFFSSLFKQPTGRCTSFAYHFHPENNRTGFVHNDFSLRMFSLQDKMSNGIIPVAREKTDTAPLFLERRIISLIFYLGNEEWTQSDGGETGLYVSKGGEPVKLIAPKNNRMLAFQISPQSFHAFQKNYKNRSSIVQWFHADDSLLPYTHTHGTYEGTTQD
jgi:hypothetical protein